MSDIIFHPASFRDPSGFIFTINGKTHRQVNNAYAGEYELLMGSGLYDHLVNSGSLISHQEDPTVSAAPSTLFKTLIPAQLTWISYPYEWCLAQLKDAALLTISILRTALEYGMILKDATPYNIQFQEGRPVFIDTLSFEKYDPAKPWVAYRQFCNMFLFPLYLEHYLKTDVQKMMIAYLDGIPVDITSKLLPLKSGLNLGVWLHVYLQNTITATSRDVGDTDRFNKKKLLNLVSHLETIIMGLGIKQGRSEWSHYYQETILGQDYLDEKRKVFLACMEGLEIKTALDLGCNDGYFAKILADKGIDVVATDSDSRTISVLYAEVKRKNIHHILPLVMDAANPSPAIGFHNQERASFHERISPDLVLALALIHHLVIGRNVSLEKLAGYFKDVAPRLIIEWVPKDDDKVIQMLASRKDVFPDYTREYFEHCFQPFFYIEKQFVIPGTKRIMYYLIRRSG